MFSAGLKGQRELVRPNGDCARTDEDDMVVELVLALASRAVAFPVHLGHLLQAVEHGRDDPLVLRVDDLADVEVVGAVQLRLDAGDEHLRDRMGQRSAHCETRSGTHRKHANEGHDALPLLEGELGLLDAADLLLLRDRTSLVRSGRSERKETARTQERSRAARDR